MWADREERLPNKIAMEEKNFKVSFLNQEYNAWYVTTPKTAKRILQELEPKDVVFGIDTETAAYSKYLNRPRSALSPHLSEIRLFQIFDGRNTVVFDLFCLNSSVDFIPFLSSKRFIAHNAIFDLQYFLKLGVVEMQIGCTRILSKLLFHACYPVDSGLDASLGSLCEQFLKVPVSKAQQISDWSSPDLTFEQVEYAALDAIAVIKLAEKLAPGLTKYGLERVYKLSKEAQLPLAKMQINGLKLDTDAHKILIDKWRDSAFEAKKKVLKVTGLDDITSNKLSLWLSDSLPSDVLRAWPRTPGGKLSTDAHTFADFSHLEVVAPMLEFQKATTLAGTFGQGLIDQINPATGRLHCKYNICGARTGRLSCSEPNFQNMPRDPEFRACFTAWGEGKNLLTADYSQIELRVAAELSQDKNMLKVYRDGEDIYKVTAAKLNRKRIEDVSKGERQVAKALALGLLFGLGSTKFAHYARKGYGVEISQTEAERAIEKFREIYPQYREWQLDQANNAKETQLVYTPCGKRRRLPAEETFGNSMNHPIQGGAAEVLLHGLVELEKKSRQYGFRLLNTVHDEVVLEIEENSSEEISAVVEKTMINAYLSVFPKGTTNKLVNIGVGKNWAEAK